MPKETKDKTKEAGAAVVKKDDSMVALMVDQAAQRMPGIAPYINTAKPYIVMTADVVDKSYPYVVLLIDRACTLWDKLQPYNPEQFFPLVFGLVLCFFGGSYVTLIAAVEAVRLSVWERMKTSFWALRKQYVAAKEASKKDDAVDDNKDGVPDVQQITKKDLLSRKVVLVLKTVDPDKATEAITILWAAILAVVATLRIQFAQAVTLGCSMGEMAQRHLDHAVLPVVKKAIPPEFEKWVPTVVSYSFKIAGVIIAWFLQRIISGFHSAMRGGNMFVCHAIRLSKTKGWIAADVDEHSPKYSAAATIVGMIGFYWQLSNGFALPFPLNLLLLPVTILEWLLACMVAL